MSDPSLPAMGIIFNKVCVLVTAAFALTLVPGFKQPEVRDRDEQTRAAASAELLALQARMNPHFLFNALNTLERRGHHGDYAHSFSKAVRSWLRIGGSYHLGSQRTGV